MDDPLQLSLSQSTSKVVHGLKASLFHTRRAATEQGGLLSGIDPTQVNKNDPLRLWIIQLLIIVATAQLLGFGLRRIKQPKVIAEVIGGIVLGPTLMGRVPHFTEHIFPQDSLPFLSLVANIGLVLFLFLVGLEIDLQSLRRNARISAIISLGGMILPFSIGVGMAKLIFNVFVEPVTPGTSFSHFMLFTAVAYSITAFPVLCRILTELKLLETTVGVCVLSAGVGNDIVGWTLLALSVALVNATSGLTALYIVLLAVAWAVFLLVPVKFVFHRIARWTCPSPAEPSVVFMTITFLLVFASAWFTDVIGVHAIFGGFLAGLIVPREGGLAIAMTEKMEDVVSILFLPLYFTLSGLSTNLGLLNSGKIWGYTIAIIVTAWFGKFVGAATGARIAGFDNRESATIGGLMSCKGLVELIVLNVGLQAGILSTRVFSMFVLEALVLTFYTTPAVLAIYPARVRKSAFVTPKQLDDDEEDLTLAGGASAGAPKPLDEFLRNRFTVVLDRLEHLPGMMCMMQLLKPTISRTVPLPPLSPASTNLKSPSEGSDYSDKEDIKGKSKPSTPLTLQPRQYQPEITLAALRLIELSDRTSAVMKSSATETLIDQDPTLAIFKTFGEINDLTVKCSLEVVSNEDWPGSVKLHAERESTNVVVLGWAAHHVVAHSDEEKKDFKAVTPTPAAIAIQNPFDLLFRAGHIGDHQQHQHQHYSHNYTQSSIHHSHFLRSVFARSGMDVLLYVDQRPPLSQHGPGSMKVHQQHIFLPFFGGPDDRFALEMVVQMCMSERAKATVVRIEKGGNLGEVDEEVKEPERAHVEGGGGGRGGDTVGLRGGTQNTSTGLFPDTVYANANTATRLQSQTADEIAWEQCASRSGNSPYPASALSRMTFSSITSPQPLHTLRGLLAAHSPNLVVLGRSRRLAVDSHHSELKTIIGEEGSGVGMTSEVRKTVGDVATSVVISGAVKCDLVVVQAAQAAGEV